ncbi:DUF4129 domain-containing protein [Marisediminicola senii]|uniref:DUF4129 domain-containing protein n=1 Tax=Marisediminicola senii TaxID=2711233 RepID=UPI0013E9BD41|nr:DUF4129 domain-containing protein [Marisediminicola senii]
MIAATPLDPTPDEARDWLVRELAEPAYREAEPSWFDRAASAVWEWFQGLLEAGVGGTPSVLAAVVVLLVLAAIVAAYLFFGPPRLNRRSAATGALFGDDDARDAAAMRTAAQKAAAASDWPLAIEEMFRCIARGLAERAVLQTTPGTTATAFAVDAARYFTDEADELAASARSFDEVRYLSRPGSVEAWQRVAALEKRVRSAQPNFSGSAVTTDVTA